MIISCPKCAKKFNFKKEHQTSPSLKVRCSNCAHVWTIITSPSQAKKKTEPQTPSPPPPSPHTEEVSTPLPPQPDTPSDPKFVEDETVERKSFAQKIKLDWIVLFLGILIFLFIFMLDNFYYGSFFSNFTRDYSSYSVERQQAEKKERAEEKDLPEYRPKNLPKHMYSN